MLEGLRRSIRAKLTLMVVVTTFTALLFTAAVLVVYDLRTYQQAGVNDLVTQADLIGRASAPALSFDDPSAARQNLAILSVRPRIVVGVIYTTSGRIFATYVRGNVAARVPIRPGPEGHHIAGNELSVVRRIADADEVVGYVYLRADYELYSRLRSVLTIVGLVMLASLLVAGVVSYWLQAAITRPILSVTEVMRDVKSRRDYTLRARRTTEDEIGYLVESFNEMLGEVGERTAALVLANRTLQHEMAVRQHAEDALRAADQRKDEFLATLAHELRNPLAPLRNALEILQEPAGDETGAQRARDIMDRQLRQMVRLVDDLLDVSRITTGKLTLRRERVPLKPIVQSALDAASPFIAGRGIELVVSLPTHPIELDADPARLAQAFQNLLHNAAKFTEPGGHVSLDASLDDTTLTVAVADTGIGIPPDMLPRIFDMFTQLDRSLERTQSGLGVGLALTRRLIELHGGTLQAESAGVGRGSRFVVRLPLPTEAAPARVAVAEPPAANGGRRRVLLADDNLDFAETFAELLRRMGHEVCETHDGEQALDAARKWAPDVAFLDIGLPRLNGYELARALRDLPECKHTLLVAVTGWGQESDKQMARSAGFDVHVVKPMDPDRIKVILASVDASA
jgi:two-component system, sensor histidine kinase